MATLRYVTLTGVDEKTSFTKMVELSVRFPFVEWAVLVSPDNAGKGGTDSRYPSLDWVEKFGKKALKAQLNTSIHLCGKAVKSLEHEVQQAHPDADSEKLAKRVLRLVENFDRVQLNLRAKAVNLRVYEEIVRAIRNRDHNRQVIFQWNDANAEVCRKMSYSDGFETVFDTSGGRGISPQQWPVAREMNARRFGYAGGLGPDNIAEQLPLIATAAGDSMFWVDMETKLRDEKDRFDLSKCAKVLKDCADFVRADREAKGALWGSGSVDVVKLSGFKLDWWVGKVTGHEMVIPPLNAVRAMMPWRQRGQYESFAPGESGTKALNLAQEHLISLTPLDQKKWWAQAVETGEEPRPPGMWGRTPEEAILRAIVAKYRGAKVPRNFAKA